MAMWMELGRFSSDSGMVVMEESFYGTVLNPDSHKVVNFNVTH